MQVVEGPAASASLRRERRQSDHRLLLWIAALAFGGAALTLAALAAIEYGWPPTSAMRDYVGVSLLLVAIAVVGVAFGSASRPPYCFDFFELPVWYTLWTLFSLVLFGLFAFSDDPKYWLPAALSNEWIVDGLWLLVAGLAALWLGYRALWTIFPLRESVRFAAGREPSPTLVWAWYGLVSVERLWRIRAVGTAYGANVSALGDASVFNQWSIYVEDSVRLVLAIVALQVLRRRWRPRHLGWLLAIEAVFTLSTGFSKSMMVVLLVILASVLYSGVRLRAFPFFISLLGVLALAFIPVAEHFRSLIVRGVVDNQSLISVAAGVVRAIDSAWLQGMDKGLEVLTNKIVARQSEITQILGVIVNMTPEMLPHWGVDRLLAIPFYLVPRAIWLDKPSLSQGVFFSIEYLNAPSDTNTSSAFTMYGDLYLAAGWTAVFVGMFALGIVSALLYRFLKVEAMQRGDLSLTALYIALAVSMADIESSYIGLMTGLMQRLVLFGALFWALHPRLPRRPALAARHVLRRAESPGLRH